MYHHKMCGLKGSLPSLILFQNASFYLFQSLFVLLTMIIEIIILNYFLHLISLNSDISLCSISY